MPKPNLPLTVSIGLWEAMAEAVRPTFADSYLSGGRETTTTFTPHTLIGHERLSREKAAMDVLTALGLRLIRPLHFGHPDRPDAA